MRTIPRKHPEIEILAVNTDKDHIHLLVSIAPKMSVSEAVRILKTNTSRMMVKRFPFIREVYRDAKWLSGQLATLHRLSVSMSVRSRPILRTRAVKIAGKQRLNYEKLWAEARRGSLATRRLVVSVIRLEPPCGHLGSNIITKLLSEP